jgi:flavin-dependent dehydrogenase
MPAPIDVFPRAVLDGRILEEAVAVGATHRAERVRHVARTGNRRISLEVGARTVEHDFVVGADGAASVVRRSLLGEAPGSRASFATGGFHVTGLDEPEIVVWMLPDVAGYAWVFPRAGHASVGIAVPVGRGNGRELRDRALRFLARRYPGSLDLPREAYGASIPVGGGAVSGPRFALIGDAANANDAITGEGIHHAIDGGGILADTLAELGPAEASPAFARRWSAGPGGDLAACRAMARAFYRPLTADLALTVAHRNERLRRVMASTATEARPYRGLPGRLIGEVLLGRS